MALRQRTICGDLMRALLDDRSRDRCKLGGLRIGRARARNALGLDLDRTAERDVLDVLRGLRGDGDRPPIQTSLVRATQLVQQLRAWLRWDDGLREAIIDLVLGAVQQAERFGDGTGSFKRRFVIDAVARVLENNISGGELPDGAHEVLTPFVGIFVDVTVSVLNEHDAWPPIDRVKLPLLFRGKGVGAALVRVGLAVWRVWQALVSVLRASTRYERNIRQATARLAAERVALEDVLPRDRLVTVAEQTLTVLEQLGLIIAPQAHTIEALYRLTLEVVGDDEDRRREVVVIAIRVLMKQAYSDSLFLAHLLDGPVGAFVLDEVVRAVGHFVQRLGIEPARELAALAALETGESS